MHIALFLPSLEGGGAERVTVNLARGFASRGHQVDLVLASRTGPFLDAVPAERRSATRYRAADGRGVGPLDDERPPLGERQLDGRVVDRGGAGLA